MYTHVLPLLSLQLIYQESNIKTHRTFNQLVFCLLFVAFFDEKLTISFTFHFRFSFYILFFCAYFYSVLRLFHSKLFNCIVMECMNNHLIIICNALMLVLVIFTNVVIFFFRYCCLRQFKLHPPRAMK